MKLTVYHDGQFWVGVVEEIDNGKLKAGKWIFGSEPKDTEILEFIVQNSIFSIIDRLSQEVKVEDLQERRINPKRLARQVARELKAKGISSHAQEVLKLEHEQRKKEKRVTSRQQKEEDRERKREIRQQKAKAKHRGR
ncbi:YjdF family protein [Brevibacillus ruminantium]|uniref:YjdF family protein n=1 Tax=Brevibacillus ruminantium TaxID=2950604 RepID=A0ABY4WBN2_9BACL|nr:YjdF family protein [Brevibacillus ruminantium]USG64595.1 YjdF family protein [Brevibacillus ruminantium]